jgi:thiol-disulfide isomerase/thioredoxin
MKTEIVVICVVLVVLMMLMAYYSTEHMLPDFPSLLPDSIVGGSSEGSLPGGVSRVVTLHFATWCGACTAFRPTWDKMKSTTNISGLTFTENNEEDNPTPSIVNYPTISCIDEWGYRYVYYGPRTQEAIVAWAMAPSMVG